MAAHHVPEELVECIFSRAPAKSLLRFKAASKNWYSLISHDHRFAKSHVEQSKNHHVVLFQNFGETTFQTLNIDTNESCKIPVEDEFELIGSANGLICLTFFTRSPNATIRRNASGKGGCFIWNPCTSEYKRIPVPLEGKATVFGFGYDSCSDDYKIVANWDNHFRVFSLKTNSWKMHQHSFLMIDYGLHLNRALHWCFNEEMAAFDSAKEVFSYTELPDEMKIINSEHQFRPKPVTLLEYQGLLCLSGGTSLWVMKKFGDSKSWVKLTTILIHDSIRLGISTLGEVVYQLLGGSGFVKSDVQGRVSDDDKSHIACGAFQRAFKYTASLISPRAFDRLPKQSEETIERPRKQRKTTATATATISDCCATAMV